MFIVGEFKCSWLIPHEQAICFSNLIWLSRNKSVKKSRFSRMVKNSREFSLLDLDLEAFWFHFSLLKKEWKHFDFTLHFSKKSESFLFSLFTSRTSKTNSRWSLISSKEVVMFFNPSNMWFGCLNWTPGSSGAYHVCSHFRFFLLSHFQISCVYAHHGHYHNVHKPNCMRRKSRMANSLCFFFVHWFITIKTKLKKIDMCNMLEVRRHGWVFVCICFLHWIRTIQK